MKLVYDVEVEDLVALTDFHVRHSPAVQRQLTVLRWACAGLAVVGIAGTGWLLGDRVWIWVAGGAVGATLGFALFPRWFYRANQRQARRLYSEGRNAGILGRHTLALQPEGLRDTDETGEHFTAWSAVERLELTDAHVFVFTGALSAYVVARDRVVQGDLEGFLAEVQQHT